VHVAAEVGRVQGDPALHIVEKEHGGRLEKGCVTAMDPEDGGMTTTEG
jgi:hypothetical protein